MPFNFQIPTPFQKKTKSTTLIIRNFKLACFFLASLSLSAGTSAPTHADIAKALPETLVASAIRFESCGKMCSDSSGNIALRTADFNGDGIPDLVFLNTFSRGVGLGVPFIGGTIILLLGRGDGTFLPDPDLPDGIDFIYIPTQIEVGDFNRDGKTDLAVLDMESVLHVYPNQGNGAFTKISIDTTLSAYYIWQLRDFNGDGLPDLIQFPYENWPHFAAYQGNGDGTFEKIEDVTLSENPFGGSGRILPLNLNSDGMLDLVDVAAHREGEAKVGITVREFIQTGADKFEIRNQHLEDNDNSLSCSTHQPGDVSLLGTFDVNKDGKLDLILADGANLRYLLLQSDGTFRFDASFSTSNPVCGFPFVTDLNRDGHPDLIDSHRNDAIAILPGKGDSGFGPLETYPVSEAPDSASDFGDDSAGIVDLNGDGTLDYAVLLNNGNLKVLLTQPTPQKGDVDRDGKINVTDAVLTLQFITGLMQPTSIQRAAADVNGDGKIDIRDGLRILQVIVGMQA